MTITLNTILKDIPKGTKIKLNIYKKGSHGNTPLREYLDSPSTFHNEWLFQGCKESDTDTNTKKRNLKNGVKYIICLVRLCDGSSYAVGYRGIWLLTSVQEVQEDPKNNTGYSGKEYGVYKKLYGCTFIQYDLYSQCNMFWASDDRLSKFKVLESGEAFDLCTSFLEEQKRDSKMQYCVPLVKDSLGV